MRRVVAVASILALGLAVAACGSDDEAVSTSTAAPSVTAPVTDPPSTDPGSTESAAPGTDVSTPATDDVPSTADIPVVPPGTSDIPFEPPTTGDIPSGEPLTIEELLDLGRPIVLAHAGGEDQYPHSTPYAFGESAKAGVDMLDFDVQLTGDGQLIVQHDDTVDRTTGATGNVADMTYAQLAALDDAYWFTAECVCTGQPEEAYLYRGMRTGDVAPPAGYTADDFAIPLFRDMVLAHPDFPLNIEIKGEGGPGIAAAKELAKVLTETDRLDHAVVASFDDAVVAAFHEAAPTVEVTPGLAATSAFILDGTPLPDGQRILQVPPKFGDIEVLTPATVQASHDAGYLIWVWPNDRSYENAAGYQGLLELGMDGLNINFPSLGVTAVQEFMTKG